MAAFSAVLGGTITMTLTLADGQLSEILHDLVIAKGSRSGVPRVLSVDRNAPRTLSGTFQITGTSKDNAIAQIAAVNALVRGGTTLALTPTGGTYSVTLKILPSALSTPTWNDPDFEIGSKGFIPFSWTCEPYAYGPETTLVNAVSTTYPAVVDITVPGDFPAPLQINFDGASINCVFVGLFPDQTTDLPLWEGESTASKKVTWTGTSSDAAHAKAHGGYYRVISADPVLGAFADTALPAGTYLMLARNASSAAGAAGLLLAGVNVDTFTAGFRTQAGGTRHCPTLAVRGATASSFSSIRAWVSVAAMCVDYIGAVPMSWGWAMWNATDDSGRDHVTFEYDGRVYGDNIASGSYGRSGGLSAVGAQRLVVFADNPVDVGSGTLAMTTTIKVIPRYALWADDGTGLPGPSM